MPGLSSSDLKLISNYLATRKVLIITESAIARPALRRLCGNFGVKTTNILVADNFESAREKIRKSQPQIVFSDHLLGARTAFELYETLKQVYPSRLETLFFVISEKENGSLATRAADEEVDALILLPFTVEELDTAFLKTLSAKMMPTNYTKLIEGGKALMEAKRLPDALKAFRFARKADAAPVLACYYEGLAQLQSAENQAAIACFEEGLKFAPKHLRCLNALFDAYVVAGNHAGAYSIGKTVSREFTVEPKRIPQLIRLSLANGHHEDILTYYEAYSRLPGNQSDATLANTIASALVICGKQYLNNCDSRKAIDAFQKSENVSGGKPGVMKEIVISLFAVDLLDAARAVLNRSPDEARMSGDVILAEFNAVTRTGDDATVVELGTGLLEKNINEAVVYESVITRSIALKRRRSVIEELVVRACSACPDRRETFEKLLPTGYAGTQ